MPKLSQAEKVIEFLKARPRQRFTARQIASQIVLLWSDDYRQKRQNPRFGNDKAFITQIVSEIGSQKTQIVTREPQIFWQDKPRPRVYWYDPESMIDQTEVIQDEEIRVLSEHQKEHDLYPILIDYLKSELNLYCLRIDEKRSTNSRGSGGNHWLHPDIVAMQPVDSQWHNLVRTCVKQGGGQRVRLWSFEVKKELNGSNVRKSFFQAVSNSSWANEGYLVTTSISNAQVEQELRMLSALHGIGVILLNPENPSESEMMLPARARTEVDWESVNRILLENEDFRDYVELVSIYYQTGRIRKKDWNKIR